MPPKVTNSMPRDAQQRLLKLGSSIIKIKESIKELEEEKSILESKAKLIAQQHKLDKFTGSDFRLNHIVSVTQVTDDSMLLDNGVSMEIIEKSKRPVVRDYYTFSPLKEKETFK